MSELIKQTIIAITLFPQIMFLAVICCVGVMFVADMVTKKHEK